jgi:hypothetical protein
MEFEPEDFLTMLEHERQWLEFLMSVARHRDDHLKRGETIFVDEIRRVLTEMLHAHARGLRN